MSSFLKKVFRKKVKMVARRAGRRSSQVALSSFG
jgi:hypothetical protein